ncbi:MAG: nickel-responsive transcriptional regulator NikR [Acidobacteriota bacterium]|jgi:CopG family nickel-responsive transcriptional regulator
MSDVVRLSFSIEQSLVSRLEQLMAEAGYRNRSEFIRDMIRDRIVESEWRSNENVVGTVTLLYDHHVRGLTEKLTNLQHQFQGAVLANTHVHLDHHTCIEAILVQGDAETIRNVVGLLQQQKGVLRASLSLASLGEKLR